MAALENIVRKRRSHEALESVGKRGIFPFIGEVGQYRFGYAKVAQIQTYNDKISKKSNFVTVTL